MRRSQRLETVLEVAGDAERKAAAALAAAEARLLEAEHKLVELERYEQEYRAALRRKTTSGIDATQLRAFHAFIARLGDAVLQQGVVVKRAHEERDVCKTRWQDAGRRSRSVGKAVEHASEDERRAEARRDQRESDERAQRAFVASAHARPAGALRRAQSEES
jgi:flagellar FliJ protein